eukprot:s892_g1.t1
MLRLRFLLFSVASWPNCSAPRCTGWKMSAGMFPTPGPGLHTGPPRTGLVMWQPQPGMRLVKMNLQGEQAPYPTGGNSRRVGPHGTWEINAFGFL